RRLRNALERMTGRSVRVRRRIDPRLIGGFMVRYEGRVIDFSVRHRLDSLKDHLLSVMISK
ncbi:MAG: F0F1 ATP synthase subunit delta, partial [Candidatus Fermentibacter sp.]|nr:F0F1 ATP synthase subunit delta [Candidatus Fermentibacter sp.]